MLQANTTKPPRDEEDFWKMVAENYYAAKMILKMPIQDRDEAIRSEPYDAYFPSFIPYRGTSSENDQRDYFYTLGNSQIDRLAVLISERQLTPEFTQAWGVLMCSYGHTLNYLMDDSRVLAAERAAAASAEKRNLSPQRVWLAHIMWPYAKGWGKRRAGEKYAVDLIEKMIAQGGLGDFGSEWFSALLSPKRGLTGGRSLRARFSRTSSA